MHYLGIDPGTTETAYCLVDEQMHPLGFAKVSNEEMVAILNRIIEDYSDLEIAIEHIESFGMAVGQTVFETAYFIGRLTEICAVNGIEIARIYRHEEKMAICHSAKANDATIKRQLIDIYAEHPEKNYGKGSKKEPDFFYGFKADCWSAFAVIHTYRRKKDGH